jgi:polyisoprenoid-binding protein YceI
MFEKVLDAGRFPHVLIRATRTGADPTRLNADLTLHGTTRSFELPGRIESTPDGIAVSGRLTFNQTDFGGKRTLHRLKRNDADVRFGRILLKYSPQ